MVDHFKNVSPQFILCVGSGDIDVRKKMKTKFTDLGGESSSFISPCVVISQFSTVGDDCIFLKRVIVEPGVSIGNDCIFNVRANIAHGCQIGSNCQIGACVTITGEVEIGENSYLGTAATILPKVKIGKNVTIAAGAIIKKNVPDNAVVAGNPGEIKFYKK